VVSLVASTTGVFTGHFDNWRLRQLVVSLVILTTVCFDNWWFQKLAALAAGGLLVPSATGAFENWPLW
jgi:hypothetical protein